MAWKGRIGSCEWAEVCRPRVVVAHSAAATVIVIVIVIVVVFVVVFVIASLVAGVCSYLSGPVSCAAMSAVTVG